MTFLEGQQGSHVARYSKQPLVSRYSSSVSFMQGGNWWRFPLAILGGDAVTW